MSTTKSDSKTISLVTVTQNDERHLEATLQSIFQQNYPALDFIVVDRASTDSTQTIIKNKADNISHWETTPHKTFYAALQTGFSHSTGEIMGFLHSDSLHLPHTLATVNAIFNDLPQLQWISSLRPMLWDDADEPLAVKSIDGFHKQAFMRGEYLSGSIRPEATFWRRSLWEKISTNLDITLNLAGDTDLWAGFYQHAELVGVRTVLAAYRNHSLYNSFAYQDEALSILNQNGGRLSGQTRQQIAPIIPRRLKRIASSLGLTCRATNAVHNLKTASWMLRYDYI